MVLRVNNGARGIFSSRSFFIQIIIPDETQLTNQNNILIKAIYKIIKKADSIEAGHTFI